MPDENIKDTPTVQNAADVLKGWVMVALTLIFVLLYAAALFGWLEPLKDSSMITRLEPIVAVIIGYYFGRLPAQQNEKTLKEEIDRQTENADKARKAVESAKQNEGALEERIENAKTALRNAASNASENLAFEDTGITSVTAKTTANLQLIDTAIKILRK